MKRKSLCLISTLTPIIAGLAGSAPAAFAETNIAGTRYWTVPELLEFREEVEAEIADTCAGDLNCERDLRFTITERGGKYVALENFGYSSFLITAINPSAETIKVYYDDEDQMMKQMTGTSVRRPLSELYVFWAEEGIEDDPFIATYNVDLHVDQIRNGNPAQGIHPLISWNEMETGSVFPANQEVEFSIAGSNLADNNRKSILIKGDAFISVTKYSDCADSEDYEEGMECRLMYGENWKKAYIPVSATVQTEEPVVEEPVIDEPIIDEPVIDDPIIDEPVIEEPVIDEPIIEEPVIDEPAIEDPEPVIDEPIIDEPTTEEPVVDEPVIEESTVEESITDEPMNELTSEPVVSNEPTEVTKPIIVSEETPAVEITLDGQNTETTNGTETTNDAEAINDTETTKLSETTEKTGTNVAYDASSVNINATANATNAASAADSANAVDDINNAEDEIDEEEDDEEDGEIDLTPTSGSAACREHIDFPWWLVVLLILGDILVVWWFLPVEQKNRRKH